MVLVAPAAHPRYAINLAVYRCSQTGASSMVLGVVGADSVSAAAHFLLDLYPQRLA